MATAAEWAWLAGILEGEGSLVRGWTLTVNMVDRDVVERCHQVAGVGSVTFVRRAQANWQDQWRWRVSARDDLAMVVRRTRRWLGERRGQRADEFLAWYRAQPPAPTYVRLPPAEPGRCRNGHERTETPCRACARDRQRRRRAGLADAVRVTP